MPASIASTPAAPAKTPIPTALADALADYDDAKTLVLQHQKASTSWLQRQMGVGYNVAARHIELMEAEGVVSAPDHVGRRTVLQQADGGLQKLAEDLYAKGARIRTAANGDAQMTIPVDLPEQHRAPDCLRCWRAKVLTTPVEVTPEEGWLIHKAGRGWYRPNAEGYTSSPTEAGRYTHADALAYSHPNGLDGPRDGMTIKHKSEFVLMAE